MVSLISSLSGRPNSARFSASLLPFLPSNSRPLACQACRMLPQILWPVSAKKRQPAFESLLAKVGIGVTTLS